MPGTPEAKRLTHSGWALKYIYKTSIIQDVLKRIIKSVLIDFHPDRIGTQTLKTGQNVGGRNGTGQPHCLVQIPWGSIYLCIILEQEAILADWYSKCTDAWGIWGAEVPPITLWSHQLLNSRFLPPLSKLHCAVLPWTTQKQPTS